MDKLESLSNTLSQMTFYDIKTMYNQAKNVVLNVSETEAKVREATNDEPWGASSTLMQEIAQGTFNFQQFNEIMPCIYGRFMEKEARQWRQIYKALQLLEYLIKHGSERVVDDARSHISTLKMLRNFHYIDDKGKDQGLNVRNRAKELVELLSDVDKIRTERRKAKANKAKYIGVGSDGFGSGMSFSSGGSRYGGFGSDSFNNSSSYGNDYYGGGGSSRMGGFSDSSSRRPYEEYNAGDDELASGVTRSAADRSGSTRTPARKTSAPTAAAAPAPVPNLLDFDDDDTALTTVAARTTAPGAAAGGLATNKALPAVSKPVGLDDDDFDDFQAAPNTTGGVASPVASPTVSMVPPQGAKPNLMQLLNATPASPTGFGQAQQQQRPSQQMNAFGGLGGLGGVGSAGGAHRASASLGGLQMQAQQPQQPQSPLFGGAAMRPTAASSGSFGGGMNPMSPVRTNTTSPTSSGFSTPGTGAVGQRKGGSNFDDLWNLSLASSSMSGSGKGVGNGGGQGKSIKDLEKEKTTAGLWGGQTSGKAPAGGGMGGTGFGNFGSAGMSGGGDDLLL